MVVMQLRELERNLRGWKYWAIEGKYGNRKTLPQITYRLGITGVDMRVDKEIWTIMGTKDKIQDLGEIWWDHKHHSNTSQTSLDLSSDEFPDFIYNHKIVTNCNSGNVKAI